MDELVFYRNAYDNNAVVNPKDRQAWAKLSKKLQGKFVENRGKLTLLSADLTQREEGQLLLPGGESFVFWSSDNNSLAKIRFQENATEKTRREAEALAIANENKISGVTQLLAYNGEAVIVEAPCKGKALDELRPADIANITQAQLESLFQTLDSLIRLNCHIDDAEGNFFYDSKNGFTVIDFIRETIPDNFDLVIKNLRENFVGLGIEELFDGALAAYRSKRPSLTEGHLAEVSIKEIGPLPEPPLYAGSRREGGYTPADFDEVVKKLNGVQLWALADQVSGTSLGENRHNKPFRLDNPYLKIYKTGGAQQVCARAENGKPNLRVVSISGYSADFLKNIFDPAWELDLLHPGFRCQENFAELKKYFVRIKNDIEKFYNETGLNQGERVISVGNFLSRDKIRNNFIELSHTPQACGTKISRVKGFPTANPMTFDYKALADGGCEIVYSKTARVDSYPKLVYKETNSGNVEIRFYAGKDADPEVYTG